MNTKPNSNAEGPLGRIIVAVIVALIVGSSSPWWWGKLFPPDVPSVSLPSTKVASPECSPEILRSQLLRSGSDKPGVIRTSARTMRQRLNLQDFDCVLNLATVLLEVDQNNGHGLYFSGEVWRAEAKRNLIQADISRGKMRSFFFRYLDYEPNLTPSDRDGNADVCYERENGYCAERTAWINHLMAYDFYQQAQATAKKENKIHYLQRAMKFVKNDLKFGGFDQIIPSPTLKHDIQEELESLTHHSRGTAKERAAP